MSFWQDDLHYAISGFEKLDTWLANGIKVINASPDLVAIVKAVPALAKYLPILTALVPEVGVGLTLADLAVEEIPAIAALGAAVHFAPADGDELARLREYLEH
jgi:hypothetical protein